MHTQSFGTSALIAAHLLVAVSSTAFGQSTLYVRTTGSDTNTGFSPGVALKSVSRALTLAPAGTTIYVGAGTYAGTLSPPRSGTAAQPINLVADADGTTTGDAGPVEISATGQAAVDVKVVNNISFTGFVFSGGVNSISVQNSYGIKFKGCTGRAMSGDGISITNTSGMGDVTLDNCEFSGGGGRGMLINQNALVYVNDCAFTSFAGAGVVLEWPNSVLNLTRTRIENVGGYGLEVNRGTAIASNLLVRSATGGGVRVGSHSSVNATIVNATIASVGGRGILQEGALLTVQNSIIAMTPTGIDRAGGTLTHSYNLYFNCVTAYVGASAGLHDLITDPLFTSPSDLRPISGSPAIDSGTDVSAITKTDLDRKPRPINMQFDRGCFEFGSTPPRRIIRWLESEPD